MDNRPSHFNCQFQYSVITNESEKHLLDLQNDLNKIKRRVVIKEGHINQLPTDVMTQAAAGVIWLQATYSLNILQMTEGRIVSTGGDTPNMTTHRSEQKLLFEDLMQIAENAMRMGLCATGIQFFLASVFSHKENKCEFKTSNNECRPYELNSVRTRYISKHNHVLLNNSGADFDSAVYFPYRIRNGKLNLFQLN